ncbi:hypothetical protein CRG98_044449 [Punica granatum]|uniref:Hflx-type G domain-containing protein n=1 Tax=Punica granatum TaxID=22663 RepID=A0A2I0HTY7_PUNGR|nr:hypothetical protein CRG98_044449 [Punica granatum]
MEYQLPRLTIMWTHLERQAGGKVKGMGEKQIEVDKRILRTQVGCIYGGKITLLNCLTGADVLAEDLLFATLDRTTRRIQMKNGREFLLTDTVGFIQKLPTMLVAAFRATLEEISESSLLIHVVDISHPLAEQQIDAVDKDPMVWVEALVPFNKGKLLSTIRRVGMVEKTEYTENGTLVKAHFPLWFARLRTPMRHFCTS